jgi:hypothetical protein
MNYASNATATEFANSINATCPLPQSHLPDDNYDEDYGAKMERLYANVEGKVEKEYYSRSPWAIIEAYTKGFMVTNVVTGGKASFKTWAESKSYREAVVSRYKTISSYAGWQED